MCIRDRSYSLALLDSDTLMRLSEAPQYWAVCCLHKHTVTLNHIHIRLLVKKKLTKLASNNLFTIGITVMPNATTNNNLSKLCNPNDQSVNPTFKNVRDCSSNPLYDRRPWTVLSCLQLCSLRRHGQDKTVLSCPCQRCTRCEQAIRPMLTTSGGLIINYYW